MIGFITITNQVALGIAEDLENCAAEIENGTKKSHHLVPPVLLRERAVMLRDAVTAQCNRPPVPRPVVIWAVRCRDEDHQVFSGSLEQVKDWLSSHSLHRCPQRADDAEDDCDLSRGYLDNNQDKRQLEISDVLEEISIEARVRRARLRAGAVT